MSVEIPISDRSGKPRAKEIAQAIAAKYNIEVGETRCTEIYFEWKNLILWMNLI